MKLNKLDNIILLKQYIHFLIGRNQGISVEEEYIKRIIRSKEELN
jgi:hypothetical protein